ncbi:MAG: WG repeat-containing protein [Pseudomonadota bacterium]
METKPNSFKPVQWIDAPSETLYTLDDRSANLIKFEDKRTGLFGFKDTQGNIKIPAKFAVVRPFSKNGLSDVRYEWNEWYRINTKGNIVHQALWHDNGADYYVSGLTRIIHLRKMGFANKKGKTVIAPQFDFAGPFSYDAPISVVCHGCYAEPMQPKRCKIYWNQDCYPTYVGGRWGAIDKSGNIVVPIEYDNLPQNNKLKFRKGKKCVQLFYDGQKKYQLRKANCS